MTASALARRGLRRLPAFGRLDRLLLREVAFAFAATLLGVIALYVVIDFADRAQVFGGRGWFKLALVLYANQALVLVSQLAPAAWAIAVCLVVARLSRTGELIALYGLGVGPLRLALALAVLSVPLGGGLALLYEQVGFKADARAERILATRFHRWGDWSAYHGHRAWVRGHGDRLFRLGEERDGGYEPALVLELTPDFRVRRWLEAKRLAPIPGGWRLTDGVERQFGPGLPGPDGQPIREVHFAQRDEPLPEAPAELALRSGRPRQMPARALREQIVRRESLGLDATEFRLSLAERWMAPWMVIPVALAALGLSLTWGRGGRRRPVPVAVALGLGLSLFLWAIATALHGAALSGALSPWLAAALPVGVACVVAAGSLRSAR